MFWMTNFGGSWLSLIDVRPVQQQLVASTNRRTKNLSSNHHRLPLSLRTGSVDYYSECVFLTNRFFFVFTSFPYFSSVCGFHAVD